MPVGSLSLNLRPVRLAFIVDPQNASSLREAIRINSVLWGGYLNPIIPLFRRLPRSFREQGVNAAEIYRSYIGVYDPDFIVNCTNLKLPDLQQADRKVVNASDVIHVDQDQITFYYGANIFDLLNYFQHRELRFVRQDPLSLHFPKFSNSLFLASVFGEPPLGLKQSIGRRLEQLPGYRSSRCQLTSFLDYLNPGNLFLRRFSSLYTELIPRRHLTNDYVFLLDVTKRIDIIDYWNLRALGWTIIPIPRQIATKEHVVKWVANFVTNRSQHPAGTNFLNYVNVLKSRSCPVTERQAFSSAISALLPAAKSPNDWQLVSQDWLPDVWRSWRVEEGANALPIFRAGEKRYDLSEASDSTRFTPLFPKFTENLFSSLGYCANEITLRVYGQTDLTAEVIPEGGPKVARSVNRISSSHWRASKTGAVFYPTYRGFSETLKIPDAESVFAAWMAEHNVAVRLSDKGRLAKQILKQVGGIYGASLLCNHPLLKLIDRLSNKMSINTSSLRSQLWQIVGQAKQARLEPLIASLVESKVIQLGLELQCPVCTRRSWYSIEAAKYELQCPKCLESFTLPTHDPKALVWSYRTIGPFSIPQMADGAYAVILALKLFAIGLDAATTPMFSFTASINGQAFEVDLGLFFQRGFHDQNRSDLILVECTSHGTLEKRDVDRLVTFGRQFPGSSLVFATLNGQLTSTEIALLSPLAERSRKRRLNGKPHNPIIVLTETELFADFRLYETWEMKGHPHKGHEDVMHDRDPLWALADATQQLYLGLEPWQQLMHKEFLARRQTLQSTQNGAKVTSR